MTGASASREGGKSVIAAPGVGASRSGESKPLTPTQEAAVAGSEDHVSEMMGRLRLTAAEAAAVVLDDGADDISVHSPWALVGKVLSPNTLHISTISAALRPAWGNPRGLVLNSAGDNIFVAEFGTKADKMRVVDGPPWVVGKHAVLLQEFNIDLQPRDMVFNGLKIWARIINLPFGYMHKRWGAPIAGSLGIEGSTPVVDCDLTGERDADGKLPYSADRLCAPDERKKRAQAAKSSSGTMSGDHGFSTTTPSGEKPSQLASKGAATGQPSKHGEATEMSSPVKRKQPRARANNAKARKGQGKEKVTGQESGGLLVGHKRKQQYHAKEPPGEVEAVNPLALVVHQGASAQDVGATRVEETSTDSNKKLRKGVGNGSADQAGAVEQPRHTQ
ncbi:hypothetical protein ACQ4PT_056077 [Festuca glaucescens]